MNINLKDINIQTRSLAERYINAKAWGKDNFHVPELCAEEKRWLTERGIPYSYDSRLHEWEIKIENGEDNDE